MSSAIDKKEGKVIYVVGGDFAVEKMFHRRGWDTMNHYDHITAQTLGLEIALVVFTGGADLNPALYGEEPKGAIGWNDARDAFEIEAFNHFNGKVPMVGICRGAQFLCVMNGGKLIQDRSGHSGHNEVILQAHRIEEPPPKVRLSEDHHQCMIPPVDNEYEILGFDPRDQNPEILYFPKNNHLAFQAHPEWDQKVTEGVFFELLSSYIGV